jgi:uncharacterized zinc-type alcohol dehydrogenase-like protein
LVHGGISAEACSFHVPLFSAERRIITSTETAASGRPSRYWCARHGIGAEIDTISADQVNGALERLEKGDVRHRCVIDASTLVSAH